MTSARSESPSVIAARLGLTHVQSGKARSFWTWQMVIEAVPAKYWENRDLLLRKRKDVA